VKAYLKTLCTVGVLLLCAENVAAMRESLSNTGLRNAGVNLTGPLSGFKKLHPFGNDTEMDYYKNDTWNPGLTLENNQKELIRKVTDNCCDFSFKITESSENVCLGELDSSQKFFFSRKSDLDIQPDDDGNFFVIDGDQELPIHLDTANLLGFSAAGSMKEYEQKLKDCLLMIAKDPVGCKLLRVFLTKTVVNKLPKMIFVPIKKESMVSNYSTISQSVFYNMAHSLNLDEKWTKTRLITFSPEFFSHRLPSYFVRHRKEGGKEEFLISVNAMPKEALLLHEMMHFYHAFSEDKTGSISVINKRMGNKVRGVGRLNGRILPMSVILYGNDEEYHTMYGITEEGWDSVNESSYLAHRYKCIRYSHTSCTMTKGSKIRDGELGEVQRMANSECADKDKFRFFLSSDSSVKFPKFGIGQYKCTDLDPETGKKLNFAK
jgi:hypothetical protein